MHVALRSRLIPERFASPQLQALMRRRLAELGGLLLAGLAVAMLVALASYNPRDPSPDTATTVQTSNLAGPVGAAYADLMLQYFGLAGALPVLALLAEARPDQDAGLDEEVAALSGTQLRDRLIALDPLERGWIARVNQVL